MGKFAHFTRDTSKRFIPEWGYLFCYYDLSALRETLHVLHEEFLVTIKFYMKFVTRSSKVLKEAQ